MASLEVTGASGHIIDGIQDEIEDVQCQIRGMRPTGERLEGLKGVIARGERRLEQARQDLQEASIRIDSETKEIAEHKAELAELEQQLVRELRDARPGTATPVVIPPWMCDTILKLAGHLRGGGPINPTQLAASLEGLVIQPPPPEPAEELGELDPDEGEMSDDCGNFSEEDFLKAAPKRGPEQGFQEVAGRRTRAKGKTFVATPQLGQRGSTTD
jgi:hypothetical protein